MRGVPSLPLILTFHARSQRAETAICEVELSKISGNWDFRERHEQVEQLGGQTPIFQGPSSCSSLVILSNLVSNLPL